MVNLTRSWGAGPFHLVTLQADNKITWHVQEKDMFGMKHNGDASSSAGNSWAAKDSGSELSEHDKDTVATSS